MYFALDDRLLAAADALAQRSVGNQVLGVLAKHHDCVGNLSDFVAAPTLQLHVRVTPRQRLERIDGGLQGFEAAPQQAVEHHYAHQHQRQGADERPLHQLPAVGARGGHVFHQHQAACRVARHFIDRHTRHHVAACIHIHFLERGDAGRHAQSHCLVQRRCGGCGQMSPYGNEAGLATQVARQPHQGRLG